MASKPKQLKMTLVKSSHGRKPGHRECLLGLGLRRRHQTAVVDAHAENRGMINKVAYLLQVEEA